MPLHIQDPTSATAPSLHETILDASRESISGGGAFAFATRDGAELLIDDDLFRGLVTNGSFELVVGIDEITNVRALNALHGFAEQFTGLSVKVFYHDVTNATFHPKFCWFRRADQGILITGSGNLTTRGMRGNWEAFTVSILSLEELNGIEDLWNSWINEHPEWLYDPNDEVVLARAAANIITRRRRSPEEVPGGQAEEETEEAVVTDEVLPPPIPSSPVLVAEIPRGSTRWNQANFNRGNFENFFGMTIGNTTLRAVLQHVDEFGDFGPIEMRQGVSVRSQNYRLELHAAAGLEYPEENTGRPIGVFIRVAPRAFRYQLVMPSHPEYELVSDYLEDRWTGRPDRMRRVVTDVADLSSCWPGTTLLS